MHSEYDTQEDLSRYIIRHGPEIQRIIRGMMDSHTLVTVHSDNGRDSVLSTLTGIDPEQGVVFIACVPDAARNKSIFDSSEVVVTANYEHVPVQFVTRLAERTRQDGECVFKLRMPVHLLWLQRREYYRLVIPVTHPVKCYFHHGQGTLVTRVTDISLGGIGVLYHPAEFRLEPGTVYEGCQLVIPEFGDYRLSIRACNTYEETMRNGLLTLRAGCQFVNLPAFLEREIQRYINSVERERRARLL